MMPNTRGLMEDKLGITFDTVSTAKYSTRLNGIYEPNQAESIALQNSVDNYYQIFLQRVAEGRNMTVEQVHEVAQGRIWTGKKAKEIGLVDEIGELDDAIAAAADMADIEDYRIYEYPQMKNQWEQLIEQFTNTDKSAKTTAETVMDKKLGKVIPYYDFYNSCLQTEAPQARLPIMIEY